MLTLIWEILCNCRRRPPLDHQRKSLRSKVRHGQESSGQASTASASTASASTHQPAAIAAYGSNAKGKRRGGKGKGSPRTQNQLIRASVNLDNRLRAVEGILGDAVETPDSLPEAQAAVAAGPSYYELVVAKGRGHNLGPPHVRGWSQFIRELKKVSGLPVDLALALAEHAANYPDPVAVAIVVKYFTARHHHDKATIVITVSIAERIAELWFKIKQFLMARGAQQHVGPPPRGPIFRGLLEELQTT